MKNGWNFDELVVGWKRREKDKLWWGNCGSDVHGRFFAIKFQALIEHLKCHLLGLLRASDECTETSSELEPESILKILKLKIREPPTL